ncbi:MAG: hypothetical protein ACXVAX_01570 [Pseudobdellovibrio sp.]
MLLHFFLLSSFSQASDTISKVPGPKVYTKKYSQLFIRRFYNWYGEHLPVPASQEIKSLIEKQPDFLVKIDTVYINTFQIGYEESPRYTGPVVSFLSAQSAKFFKVKPPLLDHLLSEGCEFRNDSMSYIAIVKNNNSQLVRQRYDLQNTGWKLTDSLELNSGDKIPETDLVKSYYQSDSGGFIHTSGFVNEKYLSLTAQKIINSVRHHFNIDPSTLQLTDNHNFKFYYP